MAPRKKNTSSSNTGKRSVAAKARVRSKTSRKKKSSKKWPLFVGVGALFVLIGLCFSAGLWARPHVDRWLERGRKVVGVAAEALHNERPRKESRAEAPIPEASAAKRSSVTKKPVNEEKREIRVVSIPAPSGLETKIEPAPKAEPRPIPTEGSGPSLKKICLILDDFGYSLTEDVREIMELDPGINIAILPGHAYSREVMNEAAVLGNEVIIHAPFEGSSGCTEKEFIRKGDSESRIWGLLNKWYEALPNAVGINNHQGSIATSDASTMETVMKFLESRGLLFVDSWTGRNTMGFRVARRLGVPYGVRIVPFLDNHDSEKEVRAHLNRLKEKASSTVVPIAIGHITKASTRKVLLDMVPRLKGEGYELVPVSIAVHHPQPSSDPDQT